MIFMIDCCINSISPNVGILSVVPRKKRDTTPRKHITKITHIELESGEYLRSEIEYHWSYKHKILIDYPNIYNSEEYSWLIKSYEQGDTVTKGIQVFKEIAQDGSINKTRRRRQKKTEYITIADDICLNLPQPHYSLDDQDNEFFRCRCCKFDLRALPGLKSENIHWTQQQLRPALYINSIDTTTRFDCNSLLVYINARSVRSMLIKHIHGAVDAKDKQEKATHIKQFVNVLFQYTLLLFYINTSWGWKFEEINYDSMWNLAMYLLCVIQPFTVNEPNSPYDWLPCKQSWVMYLFQKEVYGLNRGIKLTFRDSKLLRKETRYMFPKETTKLTKEMFKLEFKTPCQERKEKKELALREKKKNILERNKLIKELHVQGLSNRKIALQVGCSKDTVSKVVNI